MSDVKWIKVCTGIFEDDKILLIESLPEADSIIVIWFKLLCLAGKQNNSGVFLMNDRIAYTDKMLSTIFRRKETTVKMALEVFSEYGMIEIIDNVITIPKWGKHQSFDKIDRNNEYHRKYMQQYRAKQRLIAESTCEVNSEVNGEVNVNALDKSREDKSRLDEYIENGSDEPVVSVPKKKGIFQEFAAGDKALLDALREYNEYRNKKKKPLTDGAKTRLCKRLVSMFGEDRAEMISAIYYAIDKGWMDIYKPKEQAQTQTQVQADSVSDAQTMENMKRFLESLKN